MPPPPPYVRGSCAPAVLFAIYRCKSHCLLTELARDLDKAERLFQLTLPKPKCGQDSEMLQNEAGLIETDFEQILPVLLHFVLRVSSLCPVLTRSVFCRLFMSNVIL